MRKKVDKQGYLARIRHSASHALAAAVLEMFPEAKLAIGPATADGFYYDFELPRTLIPEDLPILEEKVNKFIKANHKFEQSEMPTAKALDFVKKVGQSYKVELINDLKKEGEKKIGFYKSGDFIDMCAGPHVKSTKEIGAFKLLSIAGAYWRGSEKNKMLQRIYGTAFATQKELDEYLKLLEEAKLRDHRKIGEELELFSFKDESPGFPFWHPKGMFIYSQVESWLRGKLKEHHYEEIKTPIILSEELWHRSGHWQNYKENMYFTEIDGNSFAVKPMNCPGCILVYNSRIHSYKELPIKYSELGLVHRHELSGVLHGLFRVRAFTQDDAHVFVMPDQIEVEVIKLIDLTLEVYKYFGFKDFKLELSTRPEKSIGSDEAWKKAEKALTSALKKKKIKYELNPGDGAFYGPKIDFHINDSLGRSWQLGTIQVDFSMPERFDIRYTGADMKQHRPVMIHRAILGSLERFIGILIEHYAGALPLWLSPVQAKILPVSDKFMKYAGKVKKDLEKEDVRTEIDERNESLGKKIRDAELQKIPYMLIVGEKEVKAKKIAVRPLKGKDLGSLTLDKLIKIIKT